MKKLKDVMVYTPKGMKHHGELYEDDNHVLFFHRSVDPAKDKMRMFNAYSVNPEIIEKLKKNPEVKYLIFSERKGKGFNNLKLSAKELLGMYNGEIKDERGKVLVWKAQFSGGETIYIKMEAFDEAYKQYLKQPKLFS